MSLGRDMGGNDAHAAFSHTLDYAPLAARDTFTHVLSPLDRDAILSAGPSSRPLGALDHHPSREIPTQQLDSPSQYAASSLQHLTRHHDRTNGPDRDRNRYYGDIRRGSHDSGDTYDHNDDYRHNINAAPTKRVYDQEYERKLAYLDGRARALEGSNKRFKPTFASDYKRTMNLRPIEEYRQPPLEPVYDFHSSITYHVGTESLPSLVCDAFYAGGMNVWEIGSSGGRARRFRDRGRAHVHGQLRLRPWANDTGLP